jgi:hypothetical protein
LVQSHNLIEAALASTPLEQAACFTVRDHSGQALAYVYFEEKHGQRSAAKRLTKERGAADCCEYCRINAMIFAIAKELKNETAPAPELSCPIPSHHIIQITVIPHSIFVFLSAFGGCDADHENSLCPKKARLACFVVSNHRGQPHAYCLFRGGAWPALSGQATHQK